MASGGDEPMGGVMKEGWLQKRGKAIDLSTLIFSGWSSGRSLLAARA